MRTFDIVPGLRPDPLVSVMDPLEVPLRAGEVVVPEYIDSMPYCLPTTNQGSNPSCAGEAMAGLCEMRRWRYADIYEQLDGLACYRKAKELDGDPKPGTSLTWAVKAAMVMGWLPANTKMRIIRSADQYRYALHRHGAILSAFNVGDDWKSAADDGRIPEDPDGTDGHAVVSCYYDGHGPGVKNTWFDSDGKQWGYKGFGRMSWAKFMRTHIYSIVLEGIQR